MHLISASFAPPEGFDALEHLTRSIAILPRQHAIEVLLYTNLAHATRVLFPGVAVLVTVPEGVLLRSQADDLDWFARELTRLSCDFKVVKPAQLRRALVTLATRVEAASRA
jgi:predicted DNA-binding transcriptional regulator YafY